MKKLASITIILLSLMIASATSSVYAHSGGTNSQGCHNETKTNSYHCH